MRARGLALLLFAAPAIVFACGGQTSGTGGRDGGPGSSSSSGSGSGSSSGSSSGAGSGSGSSSGGFSSSSSGSSSGGVVVDAMVVDSPAPIVCMGNGMGGSSGGPTDGGPPPCETTASETCSDGNSYTVDCQCPQGTCTCTETSANGGSGGSVMYPGCPSCSAGNLFTLCGFPQ